MLHGKIRQYNTRCSWLAMHATHTPQMYSFSTTKQPNLHFHLRSHATSTHAPPTTLPLSHPFHTCSSPTTLSLSLLLLLLHHHHHDVSAYAKVLEYATASQSSEAEKDGTETEMAQDMPPGSMILWAVDVDPSRQQLRQSGCLRSWVSLSFEFRDHMLLLRLLPRGLVSVGRAWEWERRVLLGLRERLLGGRVVWTAAWLEEL